MSTAVNGNVSDDPKCYSRKKRSSKVSFLGDADKNDNDDNTSEVHGGDCNNSSEKPKKKKLSINTLAAYVVALRPWSFPATLTPVALGSVLYMKHSNNSLPCIWTLIASCLTVLSVHAAGNLVNTYVDYKKGVDSQKSDDRTLVDHILELNDVATMGVLFYCLACVGFMLTVYLSPSALEDLAFIFFGGLSSSFFYTGGLGLKYVALGDLLVLLTFGPITVLFTFISQGGELSLFPLLYAIPLALNTEAILHSNNTRDMETDRKSGICTLAIILGEKGSYVFFVFLLFAPFCIFTFLVANFSKLFLFPLLTITFAFSHERDFRNGKLAKMPQKIAQLNLLMGMAYVLAVALSPRGSLPGFVGV